MSSTQSKADAILDAAEGFARTRGYNGFSFRDIAGAVGVKSASVHYHYPTKADLGVAVAHRYTDRFLLGLGDPADQAVPAAALLERAVAACRAALAEQDQMCLCGMLGAEVAALPAEVKAEIRRFFELTTNWLQAVLSRDTEAGPADKATARARALRILATLEGAMILARTLEDIQVFDQIAAGITASRAAD